MTELPAIMTVQNACTYLQISRSHLYEMIKRGDLKSYSVGGHRYIDMKSLSRHFHYLGLQPLDPCAGCFQFRGNLCTGPLMRQQRMADPVHDRRLTALQRPLVSFHRSFDIGMAA